ncbi:MAG TPA: hypothetical protein VN969_30615 [Streptosporangiaceae bacterium]|nr:hypothetical protein [Streptosporangiaceae bacterium]
MYDSRAWSTRLAEGDRRDGHAGASHDGADCPGEVVAAGERLRGVGGTGARGRERGEHREAEGPADLLRGVAAALFGVGVAAVLAISSHDNSVRLSAGQTPAGYPASSQKLAGSSPASQSSGGPPPSPVPSGSGLGSPPPSRYRPARGWRRRRPVRQERSYPWRPARKVARICRR